MLVVLDGADEVPMEEFDAIFRRVSSYKRSRILIITSRTDLELRRKKVHPLGPLSPEDSKSLIEARIKDISEESQRRVLDVAEGSPVALLSIAEMASSMNAEELRRALDGLLYEVAAGTTAPQSKLITATRPLIISATEEMVKALKKQPMDVYKLHAREFEELTAELLRDMGHEVKLTKRTRDGGIDIFVYVETKWKPMLCLVDTKLYRRERTIGVEMVRTLYGTLCDYQANSAMLATTTTFSKEARDFEHKHKFQLALQDYTAMATWIQEYGTKRKP
jgi:restriction endonuclease Mrr